MMRYIKLLSLASILIFSNSCKKDKNNSAGTTVSFIATLNGASESTPNGSTATGTSTASFNTGTKILTVTTTYTGIAPTLGHIHKGAVGVAGPVVFPFTNLASPIVFTSTALDTYQEADLMANLYYVNLHSTTYGGGEIRGQLLKQ